jgi:hypothetical protein
MLVKSKLINLKIAVILLLLFGSGNHLLAQKPSPGPLAEQERNEEQRGDLYSGDAFVDTRPAGKSSTSSKSDYHVRRHGGKQTSVAKGRVFIKLGITIGRGRPATDVEIEHTQTAKVQTCAERDKTENKCIKWQDMVVERISDKTSIVDKTPVQMMIEYLAYRDPVRPKPVVDRIGYLYVVNRVEYSNGKTSPPKLIYPTKQTFEGNSIVMPGKPVILPDPQRLWQITRNQTAVQAFETYVIIVSPKPLRDSNNIELQGNNLGDNWSPLELSEALVRNWIRLWGNGVIQLDLNDGLGKLFTIREQSASGDPARTRDTVVMDTDLKKDDPRPQIGFQKATTHGGTILVTIRLPFKDTIVTATKISATNKMLQIKKESTVVNLSPVHIQLPNSTNGDQ